MLTGWLGSVLLFAGLLASTLAVDRYCPKGVLDGTDDEAFDVRCGLRRGNRCILKNWECDETIDCADSSDEFPCGYMNSVQYVYKYSGDLTFPMHNDVNMHIKATIKLTKIDKDFIMKFEEPVLSQSNDDPTNLLSSEEKRAWKKEIKFKLSDNGEIGNIYYEADHPEDILNMKKGILSLFQLETQTNDNSMTHTYEKVETDVTGKCRVRYRSEREVVPTPGNVKRLYKINVTKINDYTDCEDRPLSRYQQMDPVKCDEEPGSNVPKSRMMTQCTIYIREDKLDSQPVINSCHSNETQEFQIQKKAGDSPLVIVAVRKHLQLQKIMIESQYHRQNWNSKSSILFSFDGLYPSDDKDSQEILDEVKSTLDGLHRLVNEETKAWDLLSAEAPGLYSKLIRQLRWKVDEATFKDIYQQYYNQDKYRIWLESALPFVGSDASGEEIKDKIESGSISGMSAMKLLSRLGVVNNPSKGLCKNIMDLCKSSVVGKNATVHSTCWLAFGSLVHSYCNEKRTCPDMFIEALKAEYDANLHNQEHHVKIIKDNEKLVVALKAIGNSGQKRLLPQVLKIITTWDNHSTIMIAAIEATRRMKLDDTNQLKVQQALRDIFLNRALCPEIRMVAFEELIKTGPSTPAILMPLANNMRAEVNPLMKQFTYTYLDSESKIKCPAKKSRKASIDLLARTAGLPRPSFDIRHSFSKSFSLGDIQGIYNQGLNLEFVHTKVSAMPRYIKMKNYMTLFGLYLEHIEHKVRQREIVPLLRKLFGPHGMMEEKKSLWDFIRAKRSVDGDGFPEVYKRMKETLDPTTRSETPFKAMLSSKMFSSEIVYLVLNESHTFIQNLMKDGTIRVDKDWWSNTLKAGFKFNISANDILFDAAIKIPTSLGVPLKMKTNTAGIFALGLYVDVKTTPMLNLLSFSNKPTDISANGRECFSLSTYTQTKAFVFYRDLKLGYVVHQNMSHRCPFPIDKFTLSGQPPTQKYTVGIQMSKKKYVFSESSTTFYRFVKQRDGYIKLNKIDWKAPQMSVMPGIGIRPGGGQSSGGQVPGMGGGFQFPGIGQPQSGAGQPPPGWGPAAGAGQASGGQQAGWAPPVGAGQGFGQQSGSSTTPSAGQSSGGQLPSQGSGADDVVNSTMSVDVHVASSSAEFGQERCFEAWNKSMKLCMKTDNETSVSRMWYDPNTRIIEEIQIKYQNTTKEGDKESKFLLEFHVNGEKDTKIAEYHMELNVTAPRKRQPSLWDPTSSGIAANSGGFSAKAYEKKNGAISYMACMKSSLNVTAMQWDLGVQWGKTCKQYSINMSTALYYEQGNPSLNLSVSWDSLPAMVERLTCPKKYFEEMQKKILEELKKQMGSNAGMGAQGGKPGGMGGLPSGMSGGAGGMGGLPSGMSGGAGGMGGWPSGMSGGDGGMGGLPSGMSGGDGGMGGWPSGMSGGDGGMGGWPSGMSGGAGGMGGLPSGMSGGAGGMGGLPSGMSGGAGGKIGRAGGKSGGAGSISGGAGSISGGAGSISGGAGGISGGSGGITAGGIGGRIPGMGGAITSGGLPGGIPSLGQIPCIKRLDFKISLTNSTTLEVSGTLLPKPLTYSLPFNGTKVFEETKDILTYGITETCKVYNTDEITTFDKNTFTYDQSKGCPHVLAKDCSDKDLFTVFMKKDDKNKRIYTLVIKDKKNRGHVFEINHDLTVNHDGGLLQLKGNAKHKEADIPKLCKVMLKKSKHLIIKCRVGVILEASSSGLKIKVTPWYFGYMCGMCGNFNWEPNDDFERAPRDYRKANNDTFGASWLVPGKTCTSECKLVHHPDIQKPTGKLCISTSPVTRCAPNCQPTRQASSKLSYHCLDNGTDEATKVEKQITDKKFDEILKAFNGKEKDMKAQADVHVDCQCTCPAS